MSQYQYVKFTAIVSILMPLVCSQLASGARYDRIVTVGGAATEIVYALGAGDQVVAVDLSSTYPESTQDLPQVGYIRNISPEGILSMDPDLVVTTESLGPPAAKKILKQLAIPTVWCPEPNSIEALEQSVEAIAKKLDRDDQAEGIIRRVREAEGDARTESSSWDRKPVVVFFLRPPSLGAPGTAGGEATRSDSLISLAGGKNGAAGFDGFKTLSLESLIEINPDIILVGISDQHGASQATVDALRSMPMLGSLAAVQAGAVHGVPMDDLAFGPRLAESIARWNQLFASVSQ
ncbi:MAG: ABC transporter substrate-binding protein [Verrucomicrobiota bacterium]